MLINMLDFLKIATRSTKRGSIEVYPRFLVKKSSDLMIRGKDFYAIWDENNKQWSTDEYVALNLIDQEIDKEVKNLQNKTDAVVKGLYLWDSESGSIDHWHKYVQKHMRDSYHNLDETLIFLNDEPSKTNFSSKHLNYPLETGNHDSFDEIISTLYSPDERKKIEWAIGSIVSGDSKDIQKFIVLYGSSGTGKSTILNIIQMLFDGYYSVFDAKALGSSNNAFALESFRNNPLVAIQHDGDLSKIEDNTRLNSVVSHELMTVNEKFKSTYSNRFNSFLFMGTNKPVKITDAKSGIIRRLIDVSPTGNLIPRKRYLELMNRIKFELGAIASYCLEVYNNNKQAYDEYIPISMLGASNDFYNFVLDSYDIFKEQNATSLKQAWEMYKVYCEEAKVLYSYSMRVFKEELKNYFLDFKERTRDEDGNLVRNRYSEFIQEKFEQYKVVKKESMANGFVFDKTESIFDKEYANRKAQYATEDGIPNYKWTNVKTKLKDLDTRRLHYVKVPENHIVIDFDLKNQKGEKSYKKNLEAANKWPLTYAELSKSGQGIHLHYIYDGDTSKLSRLYDKDIEIKVFSGGSSLRRKLTKCNDIPIKTLNAGLPMKGERVVTDRQIKSEKSLRSLIIRNLNKEILQATKPSIDFIYKILEDAYTSGLHYDIKDMRPAILAFAAKSTNNADYCIKLVNKMKFQSEDYSEGNENYKQDTIIFFDVEVFPNLFVVVWKAQESQQFVKMINPDPSEIEKLISFKLVGFNCRRYDNHILYARLMGYSNEELFRLSQRIINGSKNAFFSEAYNISYTDIYDFSSLKQSLKKFEIDLGIHHQELGLKWDEPVEEKLWDLVADYCVNDVMATEATFNARKQDFIAREILSDLSGLTVNDTTRSHATKIIFGNNRNPDLVYTDLSEMFPKYSFENGHSLYRGEDPGEGGYVYAEPGIYYDVALLDIASMHPTSIVNLNLFGSYTQRFKDILEARLAIKHHEYDKVKKIFNGALVKYLGSDEDADKLAQALKIVINSVYGYTTAKFDNPFKDPRNKDNIVAKRGSLFMINLKHEVQERGFAVAHIKTDSIKIPNATPEIIQFVIEYGKKYGYSFEHEATYKKMCLVNDAVYVAKYADGKHIFELSTGERLETEWTATGTQFQVPYIFKSLFSKSPIKFADMCETRSVTSSLYLDMKEGLPEGEHAYVFIGRIGLFCPIIPGKGGGELLREKDGKYYAVTGTKGYLWLESETVKKLNKEKDIDISYYSKLLTDAIDSINKFGDFELFSE